MRRLRTVGARLSLGLALVVAVALGVVYAVVVPSLERNLVDARLDHLVRSGEALTRPGRFPIGAFSVDLDDYVQDASLTANARVAVLVPLSNRTLQVMADSRRTGAGEDIQHDLVALRAATRGEPARATVTRGGERFAEAAFPVEESALGLTIVLFSASLEDTLANVELVERRVLLAGAIALVLAVVLGYGAASLFARRIRRLEQAAERIAGGRLDEPVIDRGADELGELAAAFERMRRQLAQLEHARREFIANASHELRTPIFSLGGFLELLADEELDPETRGEFLATMRGQVERLTKLATDLLDLSRIDAGRLHVEREPIDLVALAAELADEFAALAQAHGDGLEVVVEDGVAEALGDEERVLQIGRALVENALQHTPPGTPIRIRVGAAGEHAVLAVEDEGPGIAPEHADQVFERFYRVDGAKASGSGLGLSIAQELAKLMEGTLELEARGERTVFRLALPMAVAGAVPA